MESERNEKNNPRPWRVIQILMRLDILSCPTACNVYTSSVYNMLCTLFVCFRPRVVVHCTILFGFSYAWEQTEYKQRKINNI